MKLIDQALLDFKQGRSDKVYQVDLLQVGEDRYVVNFRYGRRGSNLREGSKTVSPVGLTEARRIFRALVAGKIEKGYQYRGHTTASGTREEDPTNERNSDTSGPELTPPELTPADHSILDTLRRGPPHARGGRAAAEALERAFDRRVWRAGERALAEAEPLLLDIWPRTTHIEAMRRYGLVWALGRCGSSAALSHLESVQKDPREAKMVRRMAVESLRRLYRHHDNSAYKKFVDDHMGQLPAQLAALARSGPADAYTEALWTHVQHPGEQAQRALYLSYLIDNEHVRPGLLSALARLPLKKPHFQRVRHIFKAAEFRRDGQVFGLLGHRFETSRGRRRSWYYQRGTDTEAFYDPTRNYLRRRVWRTLRRLGRDRSPDFVKMAVGVLLPFSDDDARATRERRYYRWRAPDVTLSWDRFAGYWAFNHLLYGRSDRYYPDSSGRAFRCRDGYRPGAPAPDPTRREESFPDLWEEKPQGLLHLLDESQCEQVHIFAARALLACTDFVANLDASVAAMLLSRPYDVTAQAGYELAKRLYSAAIGPDADSERIALVAAVAECRLPDARRQARAWFDSLRVRLGQTTQLTAALATSAYPDNREYARLFMRTTLYSDADARALIGRLVAAIKNMDADENERIGDIGKTLLECFGSHLSGVGIDVIRDFMAHPAAAAHEFAAGLLRNHGELANQVPDDILVALLDSPHESVRRLGAQLFSQLTDRAIIERGELLLLLSLHEHADLRESVRPIIARLARLPTQAGTDFARNLVVSLADELTRKHERGVHSHLLRVLAEDLRDHLVSLPKERVWQLLHHKHPHAQELGGILLAQNVAADALSVAEIVKLASHEILAVREGAWAMSEKNIDRLRRAMQTAIRLLDAKWADSRQWAMDFFRQNFTHAELTPDILVAICDSVRPDVQQFGRELITRNFEDSDGHTYLRQLSEHPASTLQLFASTYLERYASGDPERIAELEAFFVGILSRVNQGRIAKQRAIAFLHQQALADRASAEVAARVFARQSATIAVGEREAMIKAMVDIARAHPDIDLPIVIKPVPVRPDRRERRERARGGAHAQDSAPEARDGV